MSIEDEDYHSQKQVFKALNNIDRLKLLDKLSEGPLTAPEITEEFEKSRGGLVNDLNQLENAGIIESKFVRAEGGRNRKQFKLPEDGMRVALEVVEDDYHFELEEIEAKY